MNTTQNKTTTLNISVCNDSQNAWGDYIEDINYIVNELDVHCEISNKRLMNIIEQQQTYISDISDYKNNIVIESKGYSQSDWQDYNLHYNDFESKEQQTLFNDLIKLLKRSFTHFNNYYFELMESIVIDGKEYENKEPIENGIFVIDWIEFPNDNEILTAYNDCYGLHYDKYIIKE